jgi:hypothetical protein
VVVRELLTKWGFQVDDKGLTGVESKIAGIKSTLGYMVGAGIAAATAITALVKSTASYGEEVYKTSQKLGLTTDAVQELEYAFKLGDMSAQDFAESMKFLSKNSKEVSTETTKLDELLFIMADKFANMPNGVEKSNMALKVFGRAGTRLIPFLNQGAGGIKKLMLEAKRLGIVLDKDAIENSRKFEDSWKRLMAIMLGFKNKIGAKFLPFFNQIFEWLETVDFGSIFKGLEGMWDTFLTAGKQVVEALGGIKNVLAAIGITIAAIMWPWTLLILGFLAVEDFLAAMQGKESVIGKILGKENLADLIEGIKVVLGFAEKIRLIFVDIFYYIFMGIDKLVRGIGWVVGVLGKFGSFLGEGLAVGNADMMAANAPVSNVTTNQGGRAANANINMTVNANGVSDPAAIGTAVKDEMSSYFDQWTNEFADGVP